MSAPTTGISIDDQRNDQVKQDLNLTVSISDKGVTIAASGAVLYENDVVGKLPTIPKIPGEKGQPVYNYDALTRKMRQIKDQVGGDETKVIINANAEITYETVVATMDAIRADGAKTLFPDVLLSAGVN